MWRLEFNSAWARAHVSNLVLLFSCCVLLYLGQLPGPVFYINLFSPDIVYSSVVIYKTNAVILLFVIYCCRIFFL